MSTLVDRNRNNDEHHYFLVRNLIDAAQSGDEKQVTDIIKRCSNFQKQVLDSRNDWGSTALHHAAEGGHLGVVKILVSARASATILNNQGETCLHRATFSKKTLVVKYLAFRCSDAIDVPSDAGATPLHYAAKYGYLNIAKYLIQNNASLEKLNNIGETPVDVALRYKHLDVAYLINKEQELRDDTSVIEINELELDVINSYNKTIRFTLKPDYRHHLMIVGSLQSGKSSLKQALLGEITSSANTTIYSAIHADSSQCRIKNKQYKDWLSEPNPESNISFHNQRVKLEYTDLLVKKILLDVNEQRCLIKKKLFKSHLSKHKGDELKGVKFNQETIVHSCQILPENNNYHSELNTHCQDNYFSAESQDLKGSLSTKEDLTSYNFKKRKQEVDFSTNIKNSIPDFVLNRLHYQWSNEVFQKNPYPSDSSYLTLNFWEFSGEEKFFVIYPLFIIPRSTFIFVYNAAKLSQQYKNSKLVNSSEISESEKSILFWLSLISSQFTFNPNYFNSLSPNSYAIAWTPSVILAGTHIDLLNSADEQREAKTMINNIIAKYRSNFSFYINEPIYSYHLTVNSILLEQEQQNSFPSGSISTIHFMRRDIADLSNKIPSIKQCIPLQWSQFELIIHELRNQNRYIVSLENILKHVSHLAGMTEPMDVISMLTYFRDIGMILYYEKHHVLKRYVILNPQYLIDIISHLFCPPKSFETTSAKSAEKELKQMGLLSSRFRMCVWVNFIMTDEDEFQLLEILEAMNIIAQPLSWRLTSRCEDYFCQSLVENKCPASLFELFSSNFNILPLYFIFHHTLITKTVFFYLVSSCIKDGVGNPDLYTDISIIPLSDLSLCVFFNNDVIGFTVISEVKHYHNKYNPKSEINQINLSTASLNDVIGSKSFKNDDINFTEKLKSTRIWIENNLRCILRMWFPNANYFLAYKDSSLQNSFVKIRDKFQLPDNLREWF